MTCFAIFADSWFKSADFVPRAGNYTANFLAVVVLLDAYLTANDIDSRARGDDTSPIVLPLGIVVSVCFESVKVIVNAALSQAKAVFRHLLGFVHF